MEYSNLKNDSYLGKQFEEYKKTEEYKTYYEQIKIDKPELSIYFIEIALFGFFYEEHRTEMDEEFREKYPSLIDRPKDISYDKLEVVSEYKGISIYANEEEYLKANPHVTPIKIVGDTLKPV